MGCSKINNALQLHGGLRQECLFLMPQQPLCTHYTEDRHQMLALSRLRRMLNSKARKRRRRVPMLNSKTTTTVSMAQMEWLAMSLGSWRNARSVVKASAVASLAANKGFRGSLRANAHISATAARTASRPAAVCAETPQSNERHSGSRAPRWSCADRSEPSSGGGGRLTGSDTIAAGEGIARGPAG